ncbi:MAG: DNA polymerase III subunit delta' [Proteobacteria bacterium]|nr:DNA polymerase III subunit delta' [Pseudomonadota bacterium]
MSSALPPWQSAQWRTLSQRAERGSLPHALLLAGEQGLGKRAFAEAFVRARLCARPHAGFACGNCKTCALLQAGTHPDRVLVTREVNENTGKLRSEIIVEQIRGLSARLAMAPQLGGWQVAVVDPADALNPAAANALLKTLEEPTAASLIVLVADEPWRLPATIRSRCQRVDFVAPPFGEALAWLHAQGVADGEAILRAVGGNPGRALELARGDGMHRCAGVRKDLHALSLGRTSPRALAAAWAADEPDARLEYAARWLLDSARRRAVAASVETDPQWDADRLQQGFLRANRLRELLRGPLRSEIALLEFFSGLKA